jgi:hypothetical protein
MIPHTIQRTGHRKHGLIFGISARGIVRVNA